MREKWREQDAKISETIRRRLWRFRKGKLSSEDFEKEIKEEREITRLERILRLGKSKPKAERWKIRLHRSRGINDPDKDS